MPTPLRSSLVVLMRAVELTGGQPLSDTSAAASNPIIRVRQRAGEGSLEEAIEQALRTNPDVRVAEAEAQVAQAKLAQAKLTVAQKVAAARAAIERDRLAVKLAEAEFARLEPMTKKGFVSGGE